MRKSLLSVLILFLCAVLGFGQEMTGNGLTQLRNASSETTWNTQINLGGFNGISRQNPTVHNGNGPLITFDQGTEGTESCSIIYPGTLLDGLGPTNSFEFASDFWVEANTTFEIAKVKLLLMGNVSSAILTFKADNGNAPGAPISAPTSIAPTSHTYLSNSNGLNVYEVLFDLPVVQSFEGSDSGTKYWLNLKTTVGSEGMSNYWVNSTTINNSTYLFASLDGGVTFQDAGTLGFPVDAAFSLEGNCITPDEEEGCDWSVTVNIPDLGDEVSWQLIKEGAVILSGGPYGSGVSETKTITTSGPLEFYIETLGIWSDNEVNYSVSNGVEVLASGTLGGGTDRTYSDLNCEALEPEGCLETPNGTFGSLTPSCTGAPELVTSIAWTGEYANITVTAGTEYTFTSSVATDFITIANNGGTVAHAAGVGPLTWTATSSETVRFILHNNSDCDYSSVSRSKFVQCGDVLPPPPNDDCANAIAVSCGDSVNGSTAAATNSGGNTAADVFYKYTGTGSAQEVTVSLCGSSFDTYLRVYSDCSLTTQLVFNDDSCGAQSELTFLSDGTSTYYIMVEGFSSNSGNYVMNISCEEPFVFDDPDYDCYQGDGNISGLENGFGIHETTVFRIADDFVVEEGTVFTLRQLTMSLFSATGVTNATIKIHSDAAGLPGTEIHIMNLTPSYNEIYGAAFGFNAHRVEFALATPIELTEGTYWVSATTPNLTYWIHTTSGTSGSVLANSNNSGTSWTLTTGNERNVFYVEGDCEEDAPPVEGCLDAPNGSWGSLTPSCTGSPEVITSIAWTGEYSTVNVTAGIEYIFSSSVATDYLTISNAAGTVAYTAGVGPLPWTATATETVRFYSHLDEDCNYSNVSRSRIVQCGEPFVFDDPDYDCYQGDGNISGLENGFGIHETTVFRIADDFVVEEGTVFTLRQLTMSLFSSTGVTNATIKIHSDAAGLPGTEIHIMNLTPSYNEIYGAAFGFNAHRVEFALATPIELTEGTYWVSVTTPNLTYWIHSTSGTSGSVLANSNTSGASWTLTTGNERNVFYVEGDCEDAAPLEGCLETPNGQWPGAAYTPVCNGTTEVITDLGWFGEFSMVNVTAGTAYTFSTDVNTAFITIADSGATTTLAAGTGSVTWTAITTGQVRFITHENEDCLSSQNWVERYIQCGEPIVISEPDFPCFFGDGLASNGPEDGLNVSPATTFRTADDFTVAEEFTVQQVRINVLSTSNITSTTLNFRLDNAGSPGTIEETVTMAPSSSRVVGSGFGYPVHELTFDLATSIVLPAGTYWLEPEVTNADNSGAIYWESSSTGTTGTISQQSEDSGATWAPNEFGYNQVFFVAGECNDVVVDECDVTYVGTLQDGIGNLQGLQVANDFTVDAQTEMTITKVSMRIFADISTASLYIYEDAAGAPGTMVAPIENITPTSKTFVSNEFGFNVYNVVFDLPTPVIVEGGASETIFWVGLTTMAGTEGGSNFWEAADEYNNAEAMITTDGGTTWLPNGFGQDSAFVVEGECASLGLGDMTSFDFAYYPNPVKDVLTISSQKGVQSVSVFNLAGQQIMNNAKVSNGQINVQSLTAGTYVFRVTLEGGQVETFKIIKK